MGLLAFTNGRKASGLVWVSFKCFFTTLGHTVRNETPVMMLLKVAIYQIPTIAAKICYDSHAIVTIIYHISWNLILEASFDSGLPLLSIACLQCLFILRRTRASHC